MRDIEMIEKIVDRVLAMDIGGEAPSKADLMMDMIAVHEKIVPLNLNSMMEWPRDFDVAHDVVGIHKHLDRENIKLDDGFLPRFAHWKSPKEKRSEDAKSYVLH